MLIAEWVRAVKKGHQSATLLTSSVPTAPKEMRRLQNGINLDCLAWSENSVPDG